MTSPIPPSVARKVLRFITLFAGMLLVGAAIPNGMTAAAASTAPAPTSSTSIAVVCPLDSPSTFCCGPIIEGGPCCLPTVIGCCPIFDTAATDSSTVIPIFPCCPILETGTIMPIRCCPPNAMCVPPPPCLLENPPCLQATNTTGAKLS